MIHSLDVSVPKALRTRPKDKRGYPIPFVVFIDANKRPHFTVSSHERVAVAAKKRLCGLCGGKLKDGAWFIGGSRCFEDPRGAFIDPAMHEECARYAVQVCPYLGAPSYGRRIDDRTVSAGNLPEDTVITTNAAPMPEDRPVLFGLGRCNGFIRIPQPNGAEIFSPREGWTQIEWWQHGKRLDGAELEEALAKDRLRWR